MSAPETDLALPNVKTPIKVSTMGDLRSFSGADVKNCTIGFNVKF